MSIAHGDNSSPSKITKARWLRTHLQAEYLSIELGYTTDQTTLGFPSSAYLQEAAYKVWEILRRPGAVMLPPPTSLVPDFQFSIQSITERNALPWLTYKRQRTRRYKSLTVH